MSAVIGTPTASSMRVRFGLSVSYWASQSLAKRTVCGWVAGTWYDSRNASSVAFQLASITRPAWA